MMGIPVLHHALSGVLLTLLQIKGTLSAPVVTKIVVWQHERCSDTSSAAFPSLEPTRTVLESPDGHVFVPYTLTSSTPDTTRGVSADSTAEPTSYSKPTILTAPTSYSGPIISSAPTSYSVTSSFTTVSSLVTSSSSNDLEASSYTLPLNSELTSLTPSAVQTASSSVQAETSGVSSFFILQCTCGFAND